MSSSNASPNLLSAGALFVATALASQWLQQKIITGASTQMEEDDSGDVDYSRDNQPIHHKRREQRRIRRQRRHVRGKRQQQAKHGYPSIEEQEDSSEQERSWDDTGYDEDLDDTTEQDHSIPQSMSTAAQTTQPPLINGPLQYEQQETIFHPYQYPGSPYNDYPNDAYHGGGAISSTNYRDHYKTRRLEDRLSFDNLKQLFHNHVEQHPDASSVGGTSAATAGIGRTAVATVMDDTNRSHSQPQFPPSIAQPQPQPQPEELASSALPTNHLPAATQPPKNHPPPDHHAPKKKSTTTKHRPRGRRMSVADREDDYDFLPKNSNWNHFERYNEEDVKLGLVTYDISGGNSLIGQGQDHQHHQPFSNGGFFNHEPPVLRPSTKGMGSDPDLIRFDIDAEDDDLPNKNKNHEKVHDQKEDIPDDNSSSSEEQFVWTEAIHAHSKARHRGQIQFTTIAGENIDAQQQTSVPTSAPSGKANGGLLKEGSGHSKALHTSSIHSDIQRVTSGDHRYIKVGLSKSTSHSRSPSQSELSVGSSGTPRMEHLQDSTPKAKHHHHQQQQQYHQVSHRTARAQYNAKIMPNKMVLIRHGQSMGNIDEELYSTTPDNAMPLTKLGFEQARKAGQNLREKILAEGETVHFIVSPYVRTVETFHGIVSAWCDPKSPEFAQIENSEERLKAWYDRLLQMGLTWHEDPRIREQDFGNYQDPESIRKAKQDRHGFGVFYYRFAHGESASDVFDRVSTFLDSLWRSFDMNRSRNYVLVTHGISIRVLLARYFRYTIHQFNMLANPRNCETIVMGHDGHGRLRLEGRYQLHLKQRVVEQGQQEKAESTEVDSSAKKDSAALGTAGTPTIVTEVGEYKFYKRLRVLPKAAIRKVPIRICYE